MQPQNGAVLPGEEGSTIPVRGFAYSGGGRGIVRVEVSADGGKSWKEASLEQLREQQWLAANNRAWAWTLWRAEVPVPKLLEGERMQIMCRAVDSSYNSQVWVYLFARVFFFADLLVLFAFFFCCSATILTDLAQPSVLNVYSLTPPLLSGMYAVF